MVLELSIKICLPAGNLGRFFFSPQNIWFLHIETSPWKWKPGQIILKECCQPVSTGPALAGDSLTGTGGVFELTFQEKWGEEWFFKCSEVRRCSDITGLDRGQEPEETESCQSSWTAQPLGGVIFSLLSGAEQLSENESPVLTRSRDKAELEGGAALLHRAKVTRVIETKTCGIVLWLVVALKSPRNGCDLFSWRHWKVEKADEIFLCQAQHRALPTSAMGAIKDEICSRKSFSSPALALLQSCWAHSELPTALHLNSWTAQLSFCWSWDPTSSWDYVTEVVLPWGSHLSDWTCLKACTARKDRAQKTKIWACLQNMKCPKSAPVNGVCPNKQTNKKQKILKLKK